MSAWGDERTDLPGEEHTGLPGQPLWLAEDSFDQGRTDSRGWQLRERDPAHGGGGDDRRADLGGWGFRLIFVAAVVAVAVGFMRWRESSSVGVSSALLWGATALVAILLLWGIGLCLASIFGGEGSEGRARFGAVLGLALSGAIVIYALTGGYDTIVLERGPRSGHTVAVEPGTPVAGTESYVSEEYEYRGLELRRYRYDDYHFSVDTPAAPFLLKGEDLADWDFGVRVVVDVPGVRDDAVFEVLAAEQPDAVDSWAWVEGYLAEIETLYTSEDVLLSAERGRLNGAPCAIARSRYAGSQSPEPVVTTAFWVPGNGYEYLVRCVAFEDDWARARRPMMDIAGTFRSW
jgi:hypothetical protein